MKRTALAACFAIGAFALGGVARAEPVEPGTPVAHAAKPRLAPRPKPATEEQAQRLTDDTADTLDAGRLRVGVWKIQYGLFDFATFGSYTLPWSVLAANLQAKLRAVQLGPVSIAAQAAFAYFDSTRVRWLDRSVGDAVVTVVPLEAFFSFHVADALTLSTSAAYTEVAVDGSLSLQAFDGAGRGASDNFQLTGTAELRLSRAFALVVHGRWLMLQRVVGSANATVYPDAFTTVVVNSNASASDEFSVRDAFSVVPSVLLSLGVFNLRLGLGYGNYNVPVLNFVLPQRTLIPEFDLYLLF
jgi:hypothetical protein